MLSLSEIDAFIFDMDGLVLDTEPAYHAAWHAAIEQMNCNVSQDMIKQLSGLSYMDVLTKLQSWCGETFDEHGFKRLSSEIWRNHVAVHGIKVNQGVTELLDYAKRQAIPVALATNSVAVYAQKCLNIAGLSDNFPVMITANDVKALKPAPDIFQLAAEALNVNINQCVVFEDSYPGIAAAKAAGAYAVYVPSVLPVHAIAMELCDLMLTDLSQFLVNLTAFSGERI